MLAMSEVLEEALHLAERVDERLDATERDVPSIAAGSRREAAGWGSRPLQRSGHSPFGGWPGRPRRPSSRRSSARCRHPSSANGPRAGQSLRQAWRSSLSRRRSLSQWQRPRRSQSLRLSLNHRRRLDAVRNPSDARLPRPPAAPREMPATTPADPPQDNPPTEMPRTDKISEVEDPFD